ncbi:MAG: DUF4232 domain-containing protein, partial [Anaerolineae bacterium]|nr:DUF4232 domain-containing protein [Anaerolineae bacterium]
YTTVVEVEPVRDPVNGLWSWEGHWVLEANGRLIVDGQDMNQRLQYGEIFGYHLIRGKPFYFFSQGGRVGVSYAGEVLPQQYEKVIHYQCCSGAAYNPGGNDMMVWFFGLRDGKWHYVEMGIYGPTGDGVPPTPTPGAATALQATATWEPGQAGALVGRILIANRGSQPVVLQGTPLAVIVDGEGEELPTLRGEWQDPYSTPDQPVDLPPGQQAQVRFTWANYCGPAVAAPLAFRLRLPSGEWISAPVLDATGKPAQNVPRCNTDAPASALTVGPFEPAEAASSPTPPSSATTPAILTSIEMVDPSTGWGRSERRILRTVDGARTWRDVTPGGGLAQTASLAGSAFRSADNALVAVWDGASGQLDLWLTVDGGQSWRPNPLPVVGMAVDLAFVDSGRGWALVHQGVAAGSEGATLLATSDGGASWRELARTDPADPAAGGLPFAGLKQGIAFRDESTGWLAAFEPAPGRVPLYVTHDGGRTWQAQPLTLPEGLESAEMTPLPPTFFGTRDGILPVKVAQERPGFLLYRTRDGGATWQALTLPVPDRELPTAVALGGASEVWLLAARAEGGAVIYRSQDGGENWRGVRADLGALDITQIEFVGERGWALADGVLLRTDDAGATWLRLAPLVTLASLPGSRATHTDAEIGYAIDYPAGWYIQAEAGWLVILTSFDSSGDGVGGLRRGMAKVDLLPDKA